MRKTVTYDYGYDRGPLERVYDRLRKRSYRSSRATRDHAAYIHGVKDALNAIKNLRAFELYNMGWEAQGEELSGDTLDEYIAYENVRMAVDGDV